MFGDGDDVGDGDFDCSTPTPSSLDCVWKKKSILSKYVLSTQPYIYAKK